MPKIVWDDVGAKIWETGVDHGVIYTPTAHGIYGGGVPWNGLVSVTEKPTGAEPNNQYADNIKYLTLYSAEEFEATIEAFTFPDEFAECDGVKFVADGVAVSQQARQPFGFSYRTILGNDTQGQDFGYKLHLIYGAMVQPSEKSYETINDSPEAIALSWDMTTIPVPVPNMRPTAHIVINSITVNSEKLAALETILYGSDTDNARLPTPTEIIEMFDSTDGTSFMSPRDRAMEKSNILEASVVSGGSRIRKS